MNILAIDTSTKFLTIALSSEKDILFSYKQDVGRRHSAMLIPLLNRLLKKSNQRIEDIDLFSVGLGPGSFTGLRISLSVVKALAFSSKKKILGVSTLDAIASNVDMDGNISVILDARRGNVYVGSFQNRNSKLKRLGRYRLINFSDWFKKIRTKTFVLGDGLSVYQDMLAKNKNIVCLPEKFWYPDAKNICKLSYHRFGQYGGGDIEKIRPFYLYPKECQVRIKK